jgi:hypothetical protein
MIQRDVLFQVLDALDALDIPYVIVGVSRLWIVDFRFELVIG